MEKSVPDSDPVVTAGLAADAPLPATAEALFAEMVDLQKSMNADFARIEAATKVKTKYYLGKLNTAALAPYVGRPGGAAAGGASSSGPLSVEEHDVEMDAFAILSTFKPFAELEPVKSGIAVSAMQVLPTAKYSDLNAASEELMKLVEGWDMIMEEGRKKVAILSPFLRNYRILRASVARALVAVQDAVSKHDAIAFKLCAANTLLLEAAALGYDFDAPVGLEGTSPTQAVQLQTWIGGGSYRAWEEVYRGSRHGFSASDFHAAVDGKSRLLVLVREKEKGLLFGAFTAVGFQGGKGNEFVSDPSAFLFSLESSMGVAPARFTSNGNAFSVFYRSDFGPSYGGNHDLHICNNANTTVGSYTNVGNGYAAPSAGGPHIMSGGMRDGWLVAEMVAWVIPQKM